MVKSAERTVKFGTIAFELADSLSTGSFSTGSFMYSVLLSQDAPSSPAFTSSNGVCCVAPALSLFRRSGISNEFRLAPDYTGSSEVW